MIEVFWGLMLGLAVYVAALLNSTPGDRS